MRLHYWFSVRDTGYDKGREHRRPLGVTSDAMNTERAGGPGRVRTECAAAVGRGRVSARRSVPLGLV